MEQWGLMIGVGGNNAMPMAKEALNRVVIEPELEAKAAFIWLHGLGADGHDFEPVAKNMRFPQALAIRHILPHAPIRPVTVNGGVAMRAWYDAYGPDQAERFDETGMAASVQQVTSLLEEEYKRGIPFKRMVLAGFSQGGAVALRCAFELPHRLGGIMALSTALPQPQQTMESLVASHNRETPIFMAHGNREWHLPPEMKDRIVKVLAERAGCRIEWREYNMGHGLCAEEVADMRHWVLDVLS